MMVKIRVPKADITQARVDETASTINQLNIVCFNDDNYNIHKDLISEME